MYSIPKLQEIVTKFSNINSQAKLVVDLQVQNILLDLTYWFIEFVNGVSSTLNDHLPKLPLLEEKFNQQAERANIEINMIKKEVQTKLTQATIHQQPKEKNKHHSDIRRIIWHIQQYRNNLITSYHQTRSEMHRDCQQGYFYPKMIYYLAEKLNKQIIIYHAKKKKYFKYEPNSTNAPIFIYQKNSQLFNIMKKKQRNSDQSNSSNRFQSANKILPILSQQQDLVQNLKQSIKKQIESLVKETVNQSLRKVQFQTPVKIASNSKKNDSNHKDSFEEEIEEIHYTCGGNTKSCLNVFNDFEDYQLHMRKTHRGKVPKNSSHTIHGQYNQ